MRLLPLLLAAACGSGAPRAAGAWLVEPRFSAGSDFQAGLRFGPEGFRLGAAELGVLFDGEARPLAQAVRVRESGTFSYQYREIRYSLGAGLSLLRPVTDVFALSAAGGTAWTDGWYRGSARAPASDWVGWAEAGGRVRLAGAAHWGAAVQYRPLPGGISPFRVLVQYGWRIR